MIDELTVRAHLIADLLEGRFQTAYEDLRKFVIEWQESEQSDGR